MADEIIQRYSDKIRLVARPVGKAIVQQWGGSCWHDVRYFDTRTDDAAWHNARDMAEKLATRT